MTMTILNYISTLGLGALLTVIVKGIIDYIMHKRQWSDEISKPIVMEKLHVLRDVMITLQNFQNELKTLQMFCQLGADKSDAHVEYCRNVADKMKEFLVGVHSKLNDWSVYYDLSAIDTKFDVYQQWEWFMEDLTVISSYYESVTFCGEPSDVNQFVVQFGDKKDIASNIQRLHVSILNIEAYVQEIQAITRKNINEYCIK